MEKEFVSYEIAVALKELGAGFPYIAWYLPNNPIMILHPAAMTTTDIPAPLKQQVFRWFREKYGWYANLFTWIHEQEKGIYHEFEIYGNENGVYYFSYFKTYEGAENACIDKLIELAKQQDK